MYWYACYNQATELALLRARSHVVDSKQAKLYMDNCLEHTFLLSNWTTLPKIVKKHGTPENVVPITRGSKNIECTFFK